jgi:ribonuclease Z
MNRVFTRVHPKRAFYSHRSGGDLVTPTRKTYTGPLLVGEALMTITIGDQVEVKRFEKE